MRMLRFLTLFFIAVVFIVSLNTSVFAGVRTGPVPADECTEFCAIQCEATNFNQCKEDCFVYRGRDRGHCIAECQICSNCCYYECLEVEECDLPRTDADDRALCEDLLCEGYVEE